jgi:hypothetical protein
MTCKTDLNAISKIQNRKSEKTKQKNRGITHLAEAHLRGPPS